MKILITGILCGTALAFPAFPQDGSAATGEAEFRKCRACHTIASPAGEVIVRGGMIGPNLYGVIGRPAAAQQGYAYSKALIALREAGEIWTTEDIAAYVTDPNGFVQTKTGDGLARTKMTFKMNKHQADLAAYLATHGPVAQ